MSALQFREFMIDSTVHLAKPGDVIFKRNEYTNSVFSIVDGRVNVQINAGNQGYNLVTKYRKAKYYSLDLEEAKRATNKK